MSSPNFLGFLISSSSFDMGKFMKASLVGAKAVHGPAETDKEMIRKVKKLKFCKIKQSSLQRNVTVSL